MIDLLCVTALGFQRPRNLIAALHLCDTSDRRSKIGERRKPGEIEGGSVQSWEKS